MNSMQRLAVICMLVLGLLSAGMAQSQARPAGWGKPCRGYFPQERADLCKSASHVVFQQL